MCSIDLGTVRRIAERLSPQPQVLSLNPETLEDVFDDALRIGEAIGMQNEALVTDRRLAQPHGCPPGPRTRIRPAETGGLSRMDRPALYRRALDAPIDRARWRHPPAQPRARAGRAAGAGPVRPGNHAQGGQLDPRGGRAVAAVGPEVLFIAPCGLDLPTCIAETDKLAGQDWFEALPAVRARAGGTTNPDGGSGASTAIQMFNRPGPRLIDAFAFLVGVLNNRPELIPSNFPAVPWRG